MAKEPKESMTTITVKFTPRELEVLTALAADQLFRREFIDPKFPGHTANSAEISVGRSVISRLKTALDPAAAAAKANTARMAG